MSVYEYVVDNSTSTVTYTQEEKYIYGSSRLGVLNESVYLLGSVALDDDMSKQTHTTGQRNYELTNHLGNVLSVISDKIISRDDDGDGTTDYYVADIRQATDYSPFGVTLHGRNFKLNDPVSGNPGGKMRFGFNNMEGDNEVKGEGNSYTAEFWQYDVRLGRRWNIDPVVKSFESSYACFNDNPIRVLDPNGDDGFIDKDGNYLGDDGNKDSHETRVISKDKWKDLTGGNASKINEDIRNKLVKNSTKLEEYNAGISISEDTWQKLEAKGGDKLDPFLENKSSHTIYFKPENTDEAIAINSGQNVYAPIDGVAAPHLKSGKGKVFKVTDGINVVVTNTELDWGAWDHNGFGTVQTIRGGWKDKAWLNDLTANEVITTTYIHGATSVRTVESRSEKYSDQNWVNLFEKSGLENAQNYRKPHAIYKTSTSLSPTGRQ